MSKGQTVLVGFFFILLGIIFFIYWLILPAQYKPIVLQSLINGTNLPLLYPTNVSSAPSQYIFQNIELSNSYSYYYIANNYTIGNYINYYQIPIGNINFNTNVFYGVEEKNIYFYYNSTEYSAINISFLESCNNGQFNIYINNYKIYGSCTNNLVSIFVPGSYLNNGDNNIKIEFVPDSLIFNSHGSLNNLDINYLIVSSLNFNYYYVSGDSVLYYNFCPYQPQDVDLTVNGNSIYLYSCSNTISLNQYLNIGNNLISLTSNYPIDIQNLYIESSSNVFYLSFPNNLSNNILDIIVSQGSGELAINQNCYYNINSTQLEYSINISDCILSQNLLALKPYNYLYISMLQLS